MATIKCPDCGKEISESAVSCVNCGRPMKKKGPWLDLSMKAFFVLLFTIPWYGLGNLGGAALMSYWAGSVPTTGSSKPVYGKELFEHSYYEEPAQAQSTGRSSIDSSTIEGQIRKDGVSDDLLAKTANSQSANTASEVAAKSTPLSHYVILLIMYIIFVCPFFVSISMAKKAINARRILQESRSFPTFTLIIGWLFIVLASLNWAVSFFIVNRIPKM